ncbi:hypothetical protein MMC17_005343 [Xylographa soralifera]|nr:hypothetical protein [Xylographa soralifera]
MAPTRHIWTSVQTNQAICLEIHGVLRPQQIADKLNAVFGGTKDSRTVKHLLDNFAGRLSPSETARRGGHNVVHEEWRYWQSRGMHHQDVQQILRVHGLFEEEVPEEGDEDEEMAEAEAEAEAEAADEETEEAVKDENEDERDEDADSELDSAVTA